MEQKVFEVHNVPADASKSTINKAKAEGRVYGKILEISKANKQQAKDRAGYLAGEAIADQEFEEFINYCDLFEQYLAQSLYNYGSDFVQFKQQMDKFMQNYKKAYSKFRDTSQDCIGYCQKFSQSSRKFVALLQEYLGDDDNVPSSISFEGILLSVPELSELMLEQKQKAQNCSTRVEERLAFARNTMRDDTIKLENVAQSICSTQAKY